MIRLETEHPVAIESPDHLCPHGCIRDNYPSVGLIGEVTEYFDRNRIVMIDLGCAGGQFVVDFIKQGDIGIGLEGSSHALHGEGKSNWKKYHNKNLFFCDISKDFQLFLNEEPLKADFIHSEEVFEHISEDNLDILFDNIKKHLKPSGICAFGISLVPDIQVRDLEGNEVNPPYNENDSNLKFYKLHQSVFPATWWKEKIEKNGFEILDGGRNDENHFGYIFNHTVRWDHSGSVFICCKLKEDNV
jgi:SAM-dependent methyltransferase